MDTKEVNLFVFDTIDNFNSSKNYLGEEGSVFKRMICIENSSDFESEFNKLSNSDYIFLVVHVFATKEISGIKRFLATQISINYPRIEVMYITDKNETEVLHQMIDAKLSQVKVYKYHEVVSSIRDGLLGVYTKEQIIGFSEQVETSKSSINYFQYPQIDYAIITALYEDEFEELKKIFDFPNDSIIKIPTKIKGEYFNYYQGFYKENSSIKVVAAIPYSTGMIDSSIVATQMLEFFRPKFLIMSGVCGGSSEYSFGDIIFANKVFTFQKGKVSDVSQKNLKGEFVKVELFNKKNEKIDYEHLYDTEGNQISISVEKFEKEDESIILSSLEQTVKSRLLDIANYINESIKQDHVFSSKNISIIVAPIACSTMVINKSGFFEDTIKVINRKTAAVEMESYSVARACQFANEGNTIPIIFKSVMDNTSNKTDIVDGINYKKFAAYTSVQFMKYLFKDKLI